MLNPKLKRYVERIKELIEESREVAALERPSSIGPYIQESVKLNAWLIKTKNIIEMAFGKGSPHYKEMERLTAGNVEHSYEVNAIQGFLTGALDDLEKGFLIRQEFLVAGEIFDSVLEEAKYLNRTGHKDASAVLARVVIENSLKRIARQENIDDTFKASRINDELKNMGVYPQPQWRLIQAWLDIGNSAAHGKFEDYNEDSVTKMIDGIEQFIALHFV
jgi:hypothetical protein